VLEVPVDDGRLALRVRDRGPRRGEVVLLLHGFPQDGSCWDAVAPHLHAAGLRTLVPDQRGYSEASRSDRVADYDLDRLVSDALAVLDAVECPRAHVVGHDWGGAVAWQLAARHSDRVASATILSTPHPAALAEAVLRSPVQGLMSSYTVAFQVPVLPELVLSWSLPLLLRAAGLPEEAARRYTARLGSPEELSGPVDWYRAAARRSLDPRRSSPTDPSRVPTTYVWGRRDPALGRRAAERTARHVDAPYRFVELDEGHWLPERRPVEVAEAVVEQVGATGPAARGGVSRSRRR
jgi:pimeloyl-ACP methyl ester carboxylesterase